MHNTFLRGAELRAERVCDVANLSWHDFTRIEEVRACAACAMALGVVNDSKPLTNRLDFGYGYGYGYGYNIVRIRIIRDSGFGLWIGDWGFGLGTGDWRTGP
eukprot:266441-Prorocentrum_minimum.AAC.1